MQSRAAYWLALPALAFLTLFVFIPLFSVLRFAALDWSPTGSSFVGWSNFRRLFNDPQLLSSLRITLFFALMTLPSFLWLSRSIAMAIDGTRVERFIKVLLFMPSLITIAGSSIAWYLLYQPDFGFIYELTGFALPWSSTPWAALLYVVLFTLWQSVGYGVLVVSAALKGIPESAKEAARIDGATENQIRRFVVSPLLRPTLAFLSIIGGILSIQSYTAVFLLTKGGPFGSSSVIGYYLYETSFKFFQLGYGATITILILIITLIVAALQARVLGLGMARGQDFS